jgi:conjugative relaxase-like TrwC/TraI family protein
MVMTIHKITAGDGYLYLTRQVAHGDTDPAKEQQEQHDAAAYYTASGNPPGRWLGRGAPLLGLDGKQVTEDQMRALFGHGMHPDADAIIKAYIEQNTRAGMTPDRLARVQDEALAAARLGRRFPVYEPLDRFDKRVTRRLAIIRTETGRDPTSAEIKKVRASEARRQRAAVAGFDLVFSPVKSAALLWALDDRPHVRSAIRQAHQQAMHQALDLLEEHAAYTRTGTGGIAQIRANGLIAAAFDHYDSRAGDPNLHTHVAVSAKVQGSDGRWRSLDARALYQMTVAASEYYNTAFEVALSSMLGVTFTPRPDTTGSREPVREITGVPYGMIEHWSRRRTQIEARYSDLVRAYRHEHGRDPGPSASHKLARQANLDTRQGKKPPRSLHDRRALWRDELTDVFGPAALTRLHAAIPPAPVPPISPAPDVTDLTERAVANVSAQRSTWTVWNLRAETERLLRQERYFATAGQHRHAAEAIVALAVSPALSICTDAPALLDEPPALRRADGESVFTQHAAARYTSQAVLDAEQRLLAATRTPAITGTSTLSAQAALDGYQARSGTALDPGQRHLVTTFASDDRLLLAGIGPAGAGKTTAMRALAHVLAQHRRRLIPLATSAASAAVLARELAVPAENLHKFLHEWDHGPHAPRLRAGHPVPYPARLYALAPGDVVLVDEAGMAGTFRLDRLVSIAASRGAVVRLLGDDRQLSAVESGGALRLIAAQPGTPQLTRLYRFRDPAEAAATLQLRTGDTAAIDWYIENGRVRSGSREHMTQAAYEGWKTDMLAGKTTLMAAGDGADVTALSAQARTERVLAGQVEQDGVTLRDGNLAGAGDWIVTRENDRRLTVRGGRDWVRNGYGWKVTTRHHDGSLTCTHLEHGGNVRLPTGYVRAHVQLLYATTAHRAEGTTVDTAHPLITASMTREMLYVLASRARHTTTLYVTTHDIPPLDPDEHTDQVKHDPRSYAAREILHNILATEGSELSATSTIRTSQEQAESLATLIPRYLHAAHQLADTRYRDTAIQVLGEHDGQALIADPAWGTLVRRLYDAETTGWSPATLLTAVARQRELGTADSIAEVLCWRIDGYLADRPVPPPSGQPAVHGPRQDPSPARYTGMVMTVLGPRIAGNAQAEPTWPALLAAMRRAENTGHDVAALLAETVRNRGLRNARSISEVLAWRIGKHLTDQAVHVTDYHQHAAEVPGSLPWLSGARNVLRGCSGDLDRYLEEAAKLITTRVQALADDAIQQRPAWTSLLGHPPATDNDREHWIHHLGVIAAYRDQYQITTDDPRQILGPYAEPGHAGHAAYWHAAESVTAARRLAFPQVPIPPRHDLGDIHAQIAIDIYLALPDADRDAIASAISQRLGPLWFGDPQQADDDTIIRPVHAPELTEALIERGHLTGSLRHRHIPPAEIPVEAALIQRHAMRQPQTRTRQALNGPSHHGPVGQPNLNTKPAAAPTAAEPIRIRPL